MKNFNFDLRETGDDGISDSEGECEIDGEGLS